jgi:hypothetical protein
VGTPDIIKEMMQWLVEGKSEDLTRATAQAKAGEWAKAPYSDSSVREILDVLKTAPHTELGKLALHQLFALMKDEGRFCKVLVPVSARGPELAGLFGYTAYGAALVNDAARFRSAVYAMNTVCPDKGGRWRGIIGALYLFSPGDAVVDSVAGQAFLEGCASAPDCHAFNKLVLAAAQLKNGQNAGVVAATINGVGGAGDPRLLRVIANLEKGLKEGGAALDARVWLDYFGEGD